MFDLGWTELLLIGVVALIVVGPKDLPGMFRTLGRATAKVRGMAREFQRAMEDAADESGVKGVTKDLRNITNPSKLGMDAVKDATKDLTSWSPDKAKPRTPPPKAEFDDDRAKAAQKVNDATVRKATERMAAEAAAQDAPDPAPPADPEPAADAKGKDDA